MNMQKIYNQIKYDLKVFRANRDSALLNGVRFIMGEVQRDPDKDYSDKSIQTKLKAVRKGLLKAPTVDHVVVDLIDTYIPMPVSSIEVVHWLEVRGYDAEKLNNLPNPYVIIGQLKPVFGGRDIDGSMVKTIIDKIINGEDVLEKPSLCAEML